MELDDCGRTDVEDFGRTDPEDAGRRLCRAARWASEGSDTEDIGLRAAWHVCGIGQVSAQMAMAPRQIYERCEQR